MCGRFILTATPEALQTEFNLTNVPAALTPRYNIAPTQPVALITNEKPDELTFYLWGLIPSWSKDRSAASKMINARSETAAEKPSFRSAFRRRRCLIPTDGYYEWRTQAGEKVPTFIHMDDRKPFGMAGLWEIWHSPEGDEVRTCSILTTDANDFVSNVHNRMPVIISKENYDLWLSPDELSVDVLQPLMKPYRGDDLDAYPVSKMVNRAVVDVPECIAPLA